MPEHVENAEYIETSPCVTKPRRIWLAALLGLLAGPLAQVYVGRFRRAIILWVGQIFLYFILSFALVTCRFPYLLSSFCTIVVLYYLFIVVDACLIARRDRNVLLKRYQRWWVYVIIYMVLQASNYATAYTIRAFVAEAFVIPARSMSPTIQVGDRIIVDKFWTDPAKIKRNDVVVFRSKLFGSEETEAPTPYVKRVIGLPGETIEIKDEYVLINGEPIDDRYAVFDGPKPEVPKYLLSRVSPEQAKLFNGSSGK